MKKTMRWYRSVCRHGLGSTGDPVGGTSGATADHWSVRRRIKETPRDPRVHFVRHKDETAIGFLLRVSPPVRLRRDDRGHSVRSEVLEPLGRLHDEHVPLQR